MARSTNKAITYDDARYMNANNGFVRKKTIPTGKKCMTKAELIEYLYLYNNTGFSSRANNQLIPYQYIQRGGVPLVLSNTGYTYPEDAGNYSGTYSTRYHDGSSETAAINDKVYTNVAMTSLFDPGNEIKHYKVSGENKVMRITPQGVIADIYNTNQSLTLNMSSITREANLGSFSFSITSNTSWTVSSSSWLTKSTSSGSGNATITISYGENTTGSNRSGQIYVITSDGYISRNISVTQKAVTTYAIPLARSTSAGGACTLYPTTQTYYMDINNFNTSTKLYSDSSGTTYAPSGYYSTGIQWREWNGSSWIGSAYNCR